MCIIISNVFNAAVFCSLINTAISQGLQCIQQMLSHVYKHKQKGIKKATELINRFFILNIESGSYLSSREATLRVLSAQAVFTTVFGMGTGGILPPGHRKIRFSVQLFETNSKPHYRKLHTDND